MRFLSVLLLSLGIYNPLKAQQFALFNTKTLFDTFENPSQKAFVLDSSRQFLSNFLIPYLDLSCLSTGNSDIAIKNIINNGYNINRVGKFNNPKTAHEDINIYLFTFKLFDYHRFHKEIGFSWQIKVNSEINYDEKKSLGLYKENLLNFATIPRSNIFNNNGKIQSYHQISFNYRENYDTRLSYGFRLSLLSGIGYGEFYSNKTIANINPSANKMDVQMSGNYKLNYPDDLKFNFKNALPTKNLGAAISFGIGYTTPSGIELIANIKDLGFIRWNKNTIQSVFDESRTFSPIVGNNADKNYQEAMYTIGSSNKKHAAFTSTINSRVDFLASKSFGFYQPSLIISKNIFDNFGELAIVNSLKSGIFSFSVVPNWAIQSNFKLGIQGMLKSPNFEMFLGTNDLIQSYYASKNIVKNDKNIATGYNRASIYLGMAFKIGYIVEHPMNMSWMPGVGVGKKREGFFKRIFSIFKKKQ